MTAATLKFLLALISLPNSYYLDFLSNETPEIFSTHRIPTGSDLDYWGTNTNTYFFKYPDAVDSRKAPYWTCGYYNGDKSIDFAYILFSKDNSGPELIIFSSLTNGGYGSEVFSSADINMCIATDRGKNIKRKIGKDKLGVHMMQFFDLEGHGNIIYWSFREGKYKWYDGE